jgi:hypothetical protein
MFWLYLLRAGSPDLHTHLPDLEKQNLIGKNQNPHTFFVDFSLFFLAHLNFFVKSLFN